MNKKLTKEWLRKKTLPLRLWIFNIMFLDIVDAFVDGQDPEEIE